MHVAKELDIMITRGNHKSVCTPSNKKILLEAYQKEVQHGWQIPVTVESLKKLKNILIIPLGFQLQLAVNEKGHYADKYRFTHD